MAIMEMLQRDNRRVIGVKLINYSLRKQINVLQIDWNIQTNFFLLVFPENRSFFERN